MQSREEDKLQSNELLRYLELSQGACEAILNEAPDLLSLH